VGAAHARRDLGGRRRSAAAFVLVLRLRRRIRPRPLAWAATAVAATGFLFFVVQPSVFAVYLTHLPTRRAVHDTDLGAPSSPSR
jgi:hypothetical protein